MAISASIPAQEFPKIAGYRLTEQLYLGSRTAVYRAVQTATQRSVVIKVLREDYPSFDELVQFRNQYAIAKNLPISGMIPPLGLEAWGSGYALVMEDWDGMALSAYLKQQSLTLVDVLAIALQLSEILHNLGQNRVIHKDIKPANILIRPESNQVKLIDFSIASLLPKETQAIQSAHTLEGTLAYLAPEQTGRMNRGIDYRTDFYSLGVTLYQLLSGKLPFESEDPLELVHCHIAQLPLPVDQLNSAVPRMVAAIVSKLMAKNAEDRYQSATGLKHDLEQCLTQWKTNGDIPAFELGQCDLSDRFLIPETLYGRQSEVQALLDAFERVAAGTTELMLVAGFSGIGKTAVVNEVHKPIVRQRGYFIKGKFDQFNRNIPLSAFVQALRDLMGQLLSESDTQLQQWQRNILEALGENGQVLIEVIPELEQVIGQQPPATELSGTAAQNRFNRLFQKFISVFTTAAHPLVIFLDDLQWADLASLQLIKLLMNDSGYLLMLGAYRDNEVSPAHPFMMTVEELQKAQAVVNTITLAPLKLADTNQLVADTLHCSNHLARPLTELIAQKTQGNPFFTTQFLKALHEEGLIAFNQDHRHWECDIAAVKARSLSDDVIEFMALQLQKLPEATQQILNLAACIGNQFDLHTLATVSQQSPSDAAAGLWKALQEGLILPTSQVYKFFQGQETTATDGANSGYRFLHDRVQQAAYCLIPERERTIAHYQIGKLLLPKLSPSSSAEQTFKVVNHWNIALELVHDSDEKAQLANLNWLAGCKAKASVAYEPALQYFKTGIDLLPSNCWQIQSELALKLYEGGIKAAFLCGDYPQMDAWAEPALQQDITLLAKIKISDVQIQAQMAKGKPAMAIQIALDALQLLEITFPETPTPDDIEAELQGTKALWEQRDISELIDLPLMSNPEKIAAIVILSSIFAPSFIGKPEILPLIACKQVQLSIQYGNCAHSAFGYSNYSAILNTLCHDLESSYQFGQLAIHLVEKLNDAEVKARTFNQSAIFSIHGKVHLRETLPILQEGCRSGMASGDLEFAGYAAYNWSQYSYFSGFNLRELQQGAKNYGTLLRQINQKISLSYNQLVYQVALNLLEPTENPCCLVGESFDERVALDEFIENQVFSGIQYLFTHKIALACFFSKFEQLTQYIDQAERYLHASTGMIMVPEFYFFSAIASFQSAMNKSAEAQVQPLSKTEQYLAEMSKWAAQAPINFQHKFDLLRAQQQQVAGELYAAADLYDRAITGAKANDYIQEEALANELAANFYLAWGKEKVAAGYMQEAYACYARWGAKAKTDDLEQRYPHLLRAILEKAQPFNPLETLATIAAPHFSLHASAQTSRSSSSSSVNSTLDFAAVLRASQSLSSTIELDDLLHKLAQIILQNSGADRCALILCNPKGAWEVRAMATPTDTQLCHAPLLDNPDVPTKLIYFVKNTQEAVVMDGCETDLPVVGEYLRRHQPQSILCLPILNQGNLIGILYLQNQLTRGVFTKDRVLILNFLCTQAAISLENARLYQQTQTYAQQLEQSQLQTVQSEKMASLGNLVAGVAHEINNPIGFLNGSINNGKEYVQDLLGHLALYQQHYPNPVSPIQDDAEDIDLEFLSEDLPKLLDAMKGATDRIKGISTSLRTFSRADTEYKVKTNLHEGLDSTLLILKYRLKGCEYRPAIAVIQNYGEIPAIHCFPGQLNQVFMNILANAIDMFDEVAQQSSFESLKDNPQQITIRTILSHDAVEICIQDNGKGITEAVKTKIFDHLFTTKGVGQGTGLGLAIARQIVEEKHGGRLAVQSELGRGTEFCIRLPIVG